MVCSYSVMVCVGCDGVLRSGVCVECDGVLWSVGATSKYK